MKNALIVSTIVFTTLALPMGVSAQDATATSNTRSSSTGVGLSDNTNVNHINPGVNGISQDFSSSGNPVTNDNDVNTQTYIAPDIESPKANQYTFGFTGNNLNQRIEFACPSGGGVTFNIGSYLGGFGIATPSDELPEDCKNQVTTIMNAIQMDTAALAANQVGGDWAKVFYEELLINQMVETGLVRSRTQALLRLERNYQPGQPVTIEDLPVGR